MSHSPSCAHCGRSASATELEDWEEALLSDGTMGLLCTECDERAGKDFERVMDRLAQCGRCGRRVPEPGAWSAAETGPGGRLELLCPPCEILERPWPKFIGHGLTTYGAIAAALRVAADEFDDAERASARHFEPATLLLKVSHPRDEDSDA